MNKKIVILICLLLIMLIVGFVWAYQRRFERVERPEPEPEPDISEPLERLERDRLINDYLKEFYGLTNFDGRLYCDHEYWGSSQQNGQFQYYLWALCQEYFIDEAGDVQKGLAVQGPIILEGQVVDGLPVIISHRSFEDDPEAAFQEFPERYHDRLQESAERRSRMESSVQRSAERELLPGLGK